MFIAFIIKNGVAIVGATLLFWVGLGAGIYWEHRPAGEPSWAHVNFLFFKWSPPDSLAAKLKTAQDALGRCQNNEQALTTAINGQSALVAALSDEGAKSRAIADRAVRDYSAARDVAARRSSVIRMPIIGTDECTRVKDFDLVFKGTIR